MAIALCFLLGVVFLGALPVSAAHPNLFTNGHFDTDAAGWSPVGNDGLGGYRTTSPFSGNPGGYFILNAGGSASSDPMISQTVTGLTPGQTYVVSGDRAPAYTGFGSPSALSFGVNVDGANILNLDRGTLAGGQWAAFSVEFTATSTSHTISFLGEMNGDDSSWAFDNLSLNSAAGVPVPELSGQILALVGLAAVGAIAVVARRR